jgi:hypothetical protein
MSRITLCIGLIPLLGVSAQTPKPAPTADVRITFADPLDAPPSWDSLSNEARCPASKNSKDNGAIGFMTVDPSDHGAFANIVAKPATACNIRQRETRNSVRTAGLPPSRFSRFGEPRRSSPASTASVAGRPALRPSLPAYLAYLKCPTGPT